MFFSESIFSNTPFTVDVFNVLVSWMVIENLIERTPDRSARTGIDENWSWQMSFIYLLTYILQFPKFNVVVNSCSIIVVVNSLKEPCPGCAAPYGFHNVMALSTNTYRFAVSSKTKTKTPLIPKPNSRTKEINNNCFLCGKQQKYDENIIFWKMYRTKH
jgi:hypothetical protein